MSCYHPLIGVRDLFELTKNGKPRYRIIKSDSIDDPFDFVRNNPDDTILVPCGRCIGCRLDYSRSWADRMMLELETAGDAIFLTLTYDNDHITWCHFDQFGNPDAGTLVKKDFQDFMKRLRKNFSERRLRFYAAGEYGDRTFRPHIHLILFGIGLTDISDLRSHGINELGQAYYISDTIARIWHNGFVLLSAVSWKTCAYVARYVTKKLGSHVLTRDYLNQLPEFALMSRKPGLGRFYLLQNPDCLDFQTINLSTAEGGLEIRLPKYFLSQLNYLGTEDNPNPLYNPDKYAMITSERKQFSNDKMFLELQKTNLGFLDYLEAKENDKLKRISALKRSTV